MSSRGTSFLFPPPPVPRRNSILLPPRPSTDDDDDWQSGSGEVEVLKVTSSSVDTGFARLFEKSNIGLLYNIGIGADDALKLVRLYGDCESFSISTTRRNTPICTNGLTLCLNV